MICNCKLTEAGRRGAVGSERALWCAFRLCVFTVLALCGALPASARVHTLAAKDTLSVVEINPGEVVEFTLANGEKRTFELVSTEARVLYTNLKNAKRAEPGGGTIYEMVCNLKADGQPMQLRRYVSSQESFYEPYVINGVRLWLDAVADVADFLTYNHGECRPNAQARLALQDATLRICPEEVFAWYDNPQKFIDIAEVYNGDNTWMGPYAGADAHNGLDIRQRAGTLNYAPIRFDDHYLFESLAAGDNNNRWRGVRDWSNGDRWMLQVHHVMSLLPAEHTALEAGQALCTSGGVKYGGHEHSHYVFRIKPAGSEQEVMIDPWILFWQAFEDSKLRESALRAQMQPLAPARVGEPVAFAATLNPGPGRRVERVRWTFGDGGSSALQKPSHVFTQPGVYPVTLTVDDGARLASTTQHITVSGEALGQPALWIDCADEPSFRKRPQAAMDVYGVAPGFMPQVLRLVARAENPRPRPRQFTLRSEGGEALQQATVAITYENGKDWLAVRLEENSGQQSGFVEADASSLAPGLYRAQVLVAVPGALNSPQSFDVALLVPSHPALPPRSRRVQFPREKIVEEDDPQEVYATPWFWFSHRFPTHPQGNGGSHLMNGARAVDGEFVRFTPDLRKSRYQVRLAKAAPYTEDSRFEVRVRHAGGVDSVWMEPARSLQIGTFDFNDGTDGYVEIHAGGSRGQVLADAVIFKRIDP